MARERGLTYVKLDGNVGILGNGAGLVMSTLDVVKYAGGEPANFLDAGGGANAEAITQRGRGDPLRREGHRRAVQHLRRHHPLRRGRQGPDRGVRPDQARGAVRRAPRRHQRRGGPARCSPRPTSPTSMRSRRCSVPRRRSCSWQERTDGDPRRQGHQAVRLRHHRPRGHLPRAEQPPLRDERRRGRHARQGRPGRRGHPGLQHVPRRRRRDRRQHGDDLRAAALRGRLDPRGRRRRHRSS